MVADHEDYRPGEAPAIHAPTHENGGTDEISVAGLGGVTAELATHAGLPTIHQDAPALILTHKGDAGAHHARYTDGEAVTQADARIAIHAALPTVHQDAPALILTHKGDASAHHARYTDGEAIIQADARIAIHAALPTVHQDAPALILTHKGDAAAHHAKYTDAEARATMSPLSFSPASFVPRLDTYQWEIFQDTLRNRVILTPQNFSAGVLFPPGVTVTNVTLYGYRSDAAATLDLVLFRVDSEQNLVVMANVVGNWSDGFGSRYVDTITNPVVNNDDYSYLLTVYLDPNAVASDVQFSRATIQFTG